MDPPLQSLTHDNVIIPSGKSGDLEAHFACFEGEILGQWFVCLMKLCERYPLR